MTGHLAHARDEPFLSEPNPQPYYVREGEPGPLLNCKFDQKYIKQGQYERDWTRIVNGVPKLLARDDVVFSKDDYKLVIDESSGDYSLQIKKVQFDRDNGQFFCRLLDQTTGNQINSKPATIWVVVPPNDPVITSQPTDAVKEDDLVKIQCESTGGNPPPQFSWVFNNDTAVPSSWYQNKVEAVPRATSISILQWRVNSRENNAYLTCKIWNQAMRDGEFKIVETSRLNVQFSPRVRAGPIAVYNAEEGEPVNLSCEAEGNPMPTKFEWIHTSTGEAKEGPHWNFTAKKNSGGEYRCTAHNAVGSGNSKISVNVFYGPEVSLPKVMNPAEGDSFALDCNSKSNPAPTDPVIWQGPNGFTHIGARLVIDNIQRTYTGNYTCIVKNSFSLYSTGVVEHRSGSATTFLDVKRRPGAAIISTLKQFVNVGDSFTLHCSSDDLGSPAAKFKWATPRTNGDFSQHFNYNRQTLTVDQATLADNGLYRCMPYNEIGDGEATVIKIVVVDPAKITIFDSTKLFKSGDVDTFIECVATGYPQPKMRWLKDGLSINEAANPHWIINNKPSQNSCDNGEYCPWVMVSTVRFAGKIQWNDKGNYTCIAENGNNENLEQESMILNVVHEPHILNKLYPTEALAASDLDSTAILSCLISARPQPRIVWTRNGENVTNSEKYSIQTSQLYDRIDEYESVLEIKDVGPGDMGGYRCQAMNGLKSIGDLMITLQPKSAPRIPKNVELYESGATWITVSWKPGFDGGDYQFFELEYRVTKGGSGKFEKSSPTIFVLDDRNASTVSVFEKSSNNEIEKVDLLIHNLTMLTPMNMYYYRIRSRNAYGYSEWTPLASAMTSDAKEDKTMEAPVSLVYSSNDQKLIFEPTKLYNDTCLLLYIGERTPSDPTTTNLWRSVGCFPTDQPVQNVEASEHYKARFCRRYELSVCSPSIEILVAGNMSSQWAYTIGAPIAIIVIFIVLGLAIIFLCCRMRMPQRREKIKRNLNRVIGTAERPDVNASIQDRKNTIVHGSQNDSGVFTLGSQQNNAQISSGHAEESMAEGWPASSDEHLNCNNEQAYADDCNNKFIECQPQHFIANGSYQPYFDDYTQSNQETGIQIISSSDEQTDGSDTASTSAGGSRRVMREIIV
uniref:Uncharacterized protein n=1 Tax=Panagrolaimus sp. JU765 TaxID=591449 RepID=A0AC34QSZ8_9BILA